MSGDGAPDTKPFDCHDLRVAVVASSWHETVMDGLIDGATRALKAHQVEAPVVVRVPGSFELPVVASALGTSGPCRPRLPTAASGWGSTPAARCVSARAPAPPRSRHSTGPGSS